MLSVQKTWTEHQVWLREQAGPKPTAFNTPHRVSAAGDCLRARGMSALGAMESEEFSPQTYMAFAIGNAIHESIQDALDQDHNDWTFEAEVPIDLTEASKKVGHGVEEFGLSGHADGILTSIIDGTRTVVEIKTVSSFAAKLAWPAGRATMGHGPKREHWAQAALYAVGADADSVMIVYVSKEGDFRTGIKAGDMQQWVRGLYEVDEDTGLSLYDLALEELRHFQYVDRYTRKGMIPPAFVPDDDGSLNLMHERPEYMAKHGEWRCRYCLHNTTCRSLPADEVSVDLIELQPKRNEEV